MKETKYKILKRNYSYFIFIEYVIVTKYNMYFVLKIEHELLAFKIDISMNLYGIEKEEKVSVMLYILIITILSLDIINVHK